MTSAPSTHRASFAIGDEHAAKIVVDMLTEVFFDGEAAIAAFERPDGRWDVTVHFADAPDKALVRQLVTNAAGEEIAKAIAFDTVHHGTTRGCLLLLDHVLKAYRPRRVLDLGTGTGVLAIAAARALHERVLASDIDPPSVQVAR